VVLSFHIHWLITHITNNRVIEKCRRNWKEHVGRMSADRIPKKNLKYQLKRKTFEMMEGLCHIMPVTGLKRLNNAKGGGSGGGSGSGSGGGDDVLLT
jgi:hypothetical protein